MFLSAVSFAKSKSKNILVRMVSQAGTGFSFNTKRSRLGEKLTLLHYDPFVLGLGKIKIKVPAWSFLVRASRFIASAFWLCPHLVRGHAGSVRFLF
ncbi:39S ribosomal protein L33, mitochondrial isoform X1 [Pipistrellus kuhlii]|uniref:39S ribosomal protein L33, mitochondrial isoform X1 n=1 Tax=Pipistrellus kuhlii TaxID=59472 RepID=UPI001E2744BF|nr:39S ribosomal protein L33, mitochondrial isoform X1 [Pipistrellus kuhlii]